jgi:hypothetical protein
LQPNSGSSIEKAENLVVIDPTGRQAGAATLAWQGGVPLLKGGTILRAGFVTFLAGDDTLGVVAAGIPASESTWQLREVHTWRNMMQEMDLDVVVDLTDQAPADFMAALGGRNAAPWLLALALLLLLVEVSVGRGTRVVRKSVSGNLS